MKSLSKILRLNETDEFRCMLIGGAWNIVSVYIITENASDFGWPLTLIVVSLLSAILGAIIMVTVIKCKRSVRKQGNAVNHKKVKNP